MFPPKDYSLPAGELTGDTAGTRQVCVIKDVLRTRNISHVIVPARTRSASWAGNFRPGKWERQPFDAFSHPFSTGDYFNNSIFRVVNEAPLSRRLR